MRRLRALHKALPVWGAISRPRDDASGDVVVVDAAACRGCGLCATGCKEQAIAMLPLVS